MLDFKTEDVSKHHNKTALSSQSEKEIRLKSVPNLSLQDHNCCQRLDCHLINRIKKQDDELVKIKKDLQSAVKGRISAETAFKEQKDRMKKYLYIAGTIIVIINADQTVGLINRKGIEVLQYPESKILGKNWFDSFLPEAEKMA